MRPLLVLFSVIGVASVVLSAYVAYGAVVWYMGYDAEMWRLASSSTAVVNPFPENIATSSATTTDVANAPLIEVK